MQGTAARRAKVRLVQLVDAGFEGEHLKLACYPD